ncbi:MAG: hypothetical protein IRZ29_05105 [Thermoflavifilum sp.]|nr:hypothetical protein [Thermoflavifilum sp.]
MKTQIVLWLTGMVSVLSTQTLSAQMPPVAPPPPPVAAPGRPGPGPIQALITLTGKPGALSTNDDGIYDGFQLILTQPAIDSSTNGFYPSPSLQQGNAITVQFAPHMGSSLLPYLQKGEPITISGCWEPLPMVGSYVFHLVLLHAGNQFIGEMPPTPTLTPPADQPLSHSGIIRAFTYDRGGQINGFSFGDGWVVHFRPEVYGQLSQVLLIGKKVQAYGWKKALQPGEVADSQIQAFRAATLTVDGITYQVQ